jgi:hypothetical protein
MEVRKNKVRCNDLAYIHAMKNDFWDFAILLQERGHRSGECAGWAVQRSMQSATMDISIANIHHQVIGPTEK